MQRAEEIQRALAPVPPSRVVRSDAWYGSSRQDAKVNLPFRWMLIIGVPILIVWLLTLE
ncbi:hypothetical protein [Streptomyces sp. NPDC054975]